VSTRFCLSQEGISKNQNELRMKIVRYSLLLSLPMLILFLYAFRPGQENQTDSGFSPDTAVNYVDGIYEGYSQSLYTSEPFWGYIQISIVNGAFSNIKFTIRDTLTHEFVDSIYGTIHYSDTPEYMLQCVNEDHGIEKYPPELLKAQNVDEVDCISGATWTCNIFKATVKEAMKQKIQ
jgi:uncharacterized protein with FMN-binding domain